RLLLVIEEVEAPHLERAVVQAVARADAAVVGHVVQAFRAVAGRADRADLLAGRVLALLARHRLRDRLRLLGLAAEVAIDADPVHLARAADAVLADDEDVVLGLAGDGAGAAADAGVEVDGHRPAVALRVIVVGVEAEELRVALGEAARLALALLAELPVEELGILLVLRGGGGAHRPALLPRAVRLGADELVAPAPLV